MKQHTLFELFSRKEVIEREPDRNITCPVCNIDLKLLSISSRNEHVNKCIDPDGNSNEDGYVPVCIPELDIVSVKREIKEVIEDIPPETPVTKRTRSSKRHKVELKEETVIKIEPEVVISSSTQRVSVKNDSFEEKPKIVSKSPSLPKKRIPKEKKPLPDHKILDFSTPNNILAVDAFQFAPNPDIKVYLLTHFHSDHYIGLCKSWDRGDFIICTEITSRLMELKFKYPKEKMFVLAKYGHPYEIPGTNMLVTVHDANHCPGAGIFVIQCDEARYLHCGDFRANEEMIKMLQDKYPGGFDRCYLDNTYHDPQYKFADQKEVINETSLWVKEKCSKYKVPQKRLIDFFKSNKNNGVTSSELLVVVGTYSIGKEKIAVGIANALESKIFCSKEKYKILKTYGWDELDELITNDENESTSCRIHLVSIRHSKKEIMMDYLKKYPNFKQALVVIPTGWTHTYTSDINSSLRERFEKAFNHCAVNNPIHKIQVPYSEHSSFEELSVFQREVKCKKWIMTVHWDK